MRKYFLLAATFLLFTTPEKSVADECLGGIISEGPTYWLEVRNDLTHLCLRICMTEEYFKSEKGEDRARRFLRAVEKEDPSEVDIAKKMMDGLVEGRIKEVFDSAYIVYTCSSSNGINSCSNGEAHLCKGR